MPSSGFIDTVQTTDGADPAAEQANWVSCENDDSACNAAEGFECIALTVGSFCTRQGAWCGNSVDFCGDTETVDGVIACYQNGVGRCSLDFGHDICADVVSTVEGEDGALNPTASTLLAPTKASASVSATVAFLATEQVLT